MSLGRCYAGHSIEHKLTMAAKHGLQGIELFYEDLADLASPKTPANILSAASYVRSLCTSLNIAIICLQPFMHYDGLIDRERHAERIEEMKLWIEIAKVLDTDVIQVPSTFLGKEECSGDVDLIVEDLRELADMGLRETPTMRFAYESLSWGTHVDKWEQCWDIVQRVDRPNFGICLDSFNILGRIYADPTSPDGCNPNAAQVVKESVQRLVEQIGPHKEKIFFIQIVDAERLETPLLPGHAFYNADQPARMSWSRNCRLFYGETHHGAYLPVREVAQAIINDIGYDGWVSMELFNRAMERKDKDVVEELASRAAEGWRKMVVDLDMKVEAVKPVVGGRKDSKGEVFEDIARL
ncbi:xylose isomerase-like protein [Massarina eburnea CBS 473.64]|uniref:Xylose isomerase-like protein n=1 Tax=Massarina eburnea CBS 473.64 TaxID=1395130 RepID=A0A6A6SAB6_9PLEO|nr:xylose isomerase-like protein [Massarina eburnea CBS 473.64]